MEEDIAHHLQNVAQEALSAMRSCERERDSSFKRKPSQFSNAYGADQAIELHLLSIGVLGQQLSVLCRV